VIKYTGKYIGRLKYLMAKKATYDNESIEILKGADRVRLRPAVIFGSDGLEGCEHTIFEIVSNSIDEAKEGYGTRIEVKYFKDKSIEVKDYGRGIPLDYNEKEKRMNWELVFCELYAGGKFKKGRNETYEYSLGLNGLGACATQYAAEYMDVEVVRDGYKYNLHFEKGENIGGLKKVPTKATQTYTIIKWRPDIEVFTDINVPLEYFTNMLKKQAVVNKGLTLDLTYEMDDGNSYQETYYYENGIVDYIKEVSDEKEFSPVICFSGESSGRDREDKPEYFLKMEVALCFNNENTLIEYFHNSSWLEHGGSPEKALKNGLTAAIDDYIKQNNKYQRGEAKITFQDIEDSLIAVVNTFSTETSYENQTKKAINNKFIQDALTEFIKHNVEIYLTENRAEAIKIADQVLLNKRSRESAEKARINIKKKLSGNTDAMNRVEKFVDCRTKDVNIRELYIVEGDSALGSCKLGRDAEFQAIMPVRGKILNCLKTDFDRILKSDVIVDLVKVLGCGIEIKNKHNKNLNNFNINDLRWSKVIICTDADVDGYQIRTLILAMFYRLMPSLIKNGKVFIAESPLYEIIVGDKSYFAFNEQEKNDILKKLKNKKYVIQRSKGLGENNPDMMWETTMNPATRRLIQVTPEDEEITREVFDLLLGDNLQGRKEYIAENGSQYLNEIEVV